MVDLEVCDKIPPKLILLNAPGAVINGREVCWQRDLVDVGETVTFHIFVRVDPDVDVSRRIRNVATATAQNTGRIRAAAYNCRLCCEE